jgi:hypothetical protein
MKPSDQMDAGWLLCVRATTWAVIWFSSERQTNDRLPEAEQLDFLSLCRRAKGVLAPFISK